MTRDEAKKIVMIIYSTYPNWHPQDIKFTVDAWAMMLEEYEYNQIALALKAYIAGDTSGFAPSIGQLIDKLHTCKVPVEISELEAWSLVYKAICNSGYHAEEEFAKLPEACQIAVGSPGNLKEWAMMDTDTVASVEQSHFIRNYRAAVIRLKEDAKLPPSIRTLIGTMREQNKAIESKTNTSPSIEEKTTELKTGVPMPESAKKKLEALMNGKKYETE